MNLKNIHIVGSVFTALLGVLLHFAYDMSGGSDFVAIFSAVNESTWEHLKLLYYPVVIYGIGEYFLYGKKTTGFIASKTVALIVSMLSIVAVFYTYTGVLGENISVINIMLFLASAVLNYYLSYSFIELNAFENPSINRASIFTLILLFVFFWVFTFYPPLINLFRDPISNGFGI